MAKSSKKIIVYGIQSPSVWRVRAALIMKGLEFVHVSVNLRKRSDEFKKLTNVGKIPVLQDTDGTIVYDSRNILEYLDIKYSSTYKMFSENTKTLAEILNVIALVDVISDAAAPINYEKLGMVSKDKKPKMRFNVKAYTESDEMEARAYLKAKVDGLIKVLGNKKFFVENRFTAADACVVVLCRYLKFANVPIGSLDKWYEMMLKDKKVAMMFPSMNEKGVKEI